MLKDSRTLRRLLALAISVNLFALFAGGLYLYKTRFYIFNWLGQIAGTAFQKARSPVIPLGFYGLKVNEFNALQEHPLGKKAVIFAGDSIVEEFEWQEHFDLPSDTVILKRAISGETLERFIKRLEVTFSPKFDIQRAFIMIGINDIRKAKFQMDVFTQKYQELLDKLLVLVPPDRVCLHAIFPIRHAYISNATIQQANTYIKSYAMDRNLCYIDLFNKLVDRTGLLDANYTYDGIHLSFQGYQIWLEAIRPYIAESTHYSKRNGEIAPNIP